MSEPLRLTKTILYRGSVIYRYEITRIGAFEIHQNDAVTMPMNKWVLEFTPYVFGGKLTLAYADEFDDLVKSIECVIIDEDAA